VASELYDYQEDPLETKNLAKNKNYKEVVTEMRQLLHDWMAKQVGTAVVTTSLLDNEKPGEPNGTPLKVFVKKNFEPGQVYIGSTVAYSYLKTPAAQLLAQQFSYTTPENAVKQSAVHPEPGVWRWKKISDIVKFAEENDITVRLHGPVSPQASKWAKQDNRTPEELDKIMEEYMVEQCKKFNGNKVVKWMDVVNETVNRDGTWFGPKPGVDLWENPWLQIGMNDDGIPKYIVKAFEIANRYAPDIKLVYNQHGGMEPEMWEKVKSVILYLKKQGLRVDGIGWQAHLQSDEELAFNQKDLDYFAGLIDWAHANGLEFHVTEIDYKIKNPNVSSADLKKQAVAYANILKVLLSRRNTGVVTYNTWGLKDGVQKYHNQSRFIFDKDLRAKPAYYALQKVLSNPDDLMPDYSYDKKNTIDDGINKIQNGGFEKGMKSWISFGEIEVVSDGSQKSGESCVRLNADRSGVKQKVKVKRNTDYLLTAWLKSENNEKVRLKVMMSKENQVGKVITDADYTKVTLKFNSGDFKEIVVAFTKWNSGNGKAWADDFYLKEVKK
jgi:GH35 family endo-1,4-beta-xylanase